MHVTGGSILLHYLILFYESFVFEVLLKKNNSVVMDYTTATLATCVNNFEKYIFAAHVCLWHMRLVKSQLKFREKNLVSF